MKKNNLLHYAISFGIVITALSFGYYFIFALPRVQGDKQRLEQQKLDLQVEESERQKTLELNYQKCSDEAYDSARELLAKKIELLKETNRSKHNEYKLAYDKGLYLKDDYSGYYKKCLGRYGLEEK